MSKVYTCRGNEEKSNIKLRPIYSQRTGEVRCAGTLDFLRWQELLSKYLGFDQSVVSKTRVWIWIHGKLRDLHVIRGHPTKNIRHNVLIWVNLSTIDQLISTDIWSEQWPPLITFRHLSKQLDYVCHFLRKSATNTRRCFKIGKLTLGRKFTLLHKWHINNIPMAVCMKNTLLKPKIKVT